MPGQAIGDFVGDLEEVHQVAGTSGALDFEVVAVIRKIVHQGADDQRVDRHPDRSPPIRVAAKHAAVRLGRQITHPIFLAAHRKDIGMLGVIAGQGTDPVGAQELVLVEHAGQNPAQPTLINEPHDAPLGHAQMALPGFMDRFAQLRHAPVAVGNCRRQSGDPLALPLVYSGRRHRAAGDRPSSGP